MTGVVGTFLIACELEVQVDPSNVSVVPGPNILVGSEVVVTALEFTGSPGGDPEPPDAEAPNAQMSTGPYAT